MARDQEQIVLLRRDAAACEQVIGAVRQRLHVLTALGYIPATADATGPVIPAEAFASVDITQAEFLAAAQAAAQILQALPPQAVSALLKIARQ